MLYNFIVNFNKKIDGKDTLEIAGVAVEVDPTGRFVTIMEDKDGDHHYSFNQNIIDFIETKKIPQEEE